MDVANCATCVLNQHTLADPHWIRDENARFRGVVMNKLTVLIAILGLAGCSLSGRAAVSTPLQAAVRAAGSVVQAIATVIAQDWVVRSRAEPLCPLC
jgi:uncharacterized lipoprotein YajG